MEYNSQLTEFTNFLQETLAISTDELAVVLQRRQRPSDPLPMLLWQYGLVSIEQLQLIFDWLDERLAARYETRGVAGSPFHLC